MRHLTDTQLYQAAHKMEQVGGHFASAIARAFYAADSGNRQLLLEAFGHLFDKFAPPCEESLLDTYNEQRAEARACGYEFPDFEEWLDPSVTRRRAANRLRLDAEGYDFE